MKLEQNHASALLYVSIKQSTLKILKHLALLFRALKFRCETDAFSHSSMAAFKIMFIFPFENKGKINITAYVSAQAFLRYQFYVLKYDALTWKHIWIPVTCEE